MYKTLYTLYIYICSLIYNIICTEHTHTLSLINNIGGIIYGNMFYETTLYSFTRYINIMAYIMD